MDVNIKKVAIYEPRLKLDNEREWVIVKGGQTVTTNVYPATSFSNQYFNFTTNPPGRKNVLDRHVIIEVPVILTFDGPGDGTTNLMVQENRDAFRSFPISSIVESLTCKINGFPVSIELNKFIHILENFHNGVDVANGSQSIYPNMPDNYQEYNQATINSRNPLASYGDNSNRPPRGAYPIEVEENDNEGAIIKATIYEQIVLPPFLFDDSQAGGLVNLDTLEFNFVFSSQLKRIWSRSTANEVPITTLDVKLGQPSLLLNWITPRDIQAIPDSIRYPYFQLSRYISKGKTLAALASSGDYVAANPIQLNSIPRKIYIYAKESDESISSTMEQLNSTDTFAQVESLSLSWDNTDGVLSGCKPVNLYEMSVANGLNYDWTAWNGVSQTLGQTEDVPGTFVGLKGGIICICPGVDFGLRNSQAEGVLDKINFQVKLRFKNLKDRAVNYDVYVLCVYDGFLEIFDNSCRAIIGAASPADVLTTPVDSSISYHELQKIYGGNFFTSVRDTGSKLLKKAGDANKYLRDTNLLSNVLGAVPSKYTQSASEVLKSMGYGSAGVLSGGCSGGKVASRKAMIKNLRKY